MNRQLYQPYVKGYRTEGLQYRYLIPPPTRPQNFVLVIRSTTLTFISEVETDFVRFKASESPLQNIAINAVSSILSWNDIRSGRGQIPTHELFSFRRLGKRCKHTYSSVYFLRVDSLLFQHTI